MKIAVACMGNNVSSHFGESEGFIVYDTNGTSILNNEWVKSPEHKPGVFPVFVKSLGAEVIICGGMGERAQNLFKENNIKTIVGASGLCDEAVKLYVQGKLHSDESVCHEHHHHHEH